MLKTISAALLAASMIAAPALAVNSTNAQTQANKTAQTPAAKTGQAQIATKVTRSKRLNANAKMIRHHRHKKISLHRSHPKVSFRHVATKRS